MDKEFLTLHYSRTDEGVGLSALDPEGKELSAADVLVLICQTMDLILSVLPDEGKAGALENINTVVGTVLVKHGLAENPELVLAEYIASDIVMRLAVAKKMTAAELNELPREELRTMIAAHCGGRIA
jgi:hypothetical protein